MNTTSFSIKALYAYALAEGEGVGTAYEYYAKRRVIAKLVGGLPRKAQVLIAGIPQKYGTSLDFVVAAWERGARVLLVDERPAAIERAKGALATLKSEGKLEGVDLEFRVIPSFDALRDLPKQDIVLSCEVIQRLDERQRRDYVDALRKLAPRGVVFVPNSENGAHLTISGLSGATKKEVVDLFHGEANRVGFVDLPPFPPGIKRSEEQRARATSGTAESIAMRGLEVYSAAEPFLPSILARRFAHLIYATWGE